MLLTTISEVIDTLKATFDAAPAPFDALKGVYISPGIMLGKSPTISIICDDLEYLPEDGEEEADTVEAVISIVLLAKPKSDPLEAVVAMRTWASAIRLHLIEHADLAIIPEGYEIPYALLTGSHVANITLGTMSAGGDGVNLVEDDYAHTVRVDWNVAFKESRLKADYDFGPTILHRIYEYPLETWEEDGE